MSRSQFLPSLEFMTPHLRISYPAGGFRRQRRPLTGFVVVTVQSNFFRVIQTVWKVGKDGIEAGSDLVPDSVPRPVARIGVAVVALSFSSPRHFSVLATMGLIYFTYIALSKDSGSKGGGTTSKMDDPVEEAKIIMEKYKLQIEEFTDLHMLELRRRRWKKRRTKGR